jgi:hypothetical protein
MNHHLIVWDGKKDMVKDYFRRSEEYCINTMHNLIQASLQFGIEKDLLQYISELSVRKSGPAIDPIAIPLMDYVKAIPERANKSDLDRSISSLSRLEGAIQKAATSLFRNKKMAEDLQAVITTKRKLIAEGIRRR